VSVTPLRVALADDALLFREGLSRILVESGFDVIGHHPDASSLLRQVRTDPPDVVVLDLRMPPTHTSEGLDAAVAIRALAPEIGILLLSQYVEAHYALRLMDDFAGGVGYLLKDRVSDLSAFRSDLGRIAAGDVVIDPELVRRLVERRRERDPLESLSERELDVLTLMAQGCSNAALSHKLHLSVKTIEAHVRSIFTKLGLELDEREHRRVLAVLAFLRR
jgi:DNA-binding NarL/FixJ family response regulator